MSTFIRQYSR